MFRNVLLIYLLMTCSSSLLHGGNGFSKPKVNPQDIQSELHTYLEGLKFDNIKKLEFQTYLFTAIDRDMHDTNKFPILLSLIKEIRFYAR